MISRGVYHSSEAFADRSKDVFMYYLHLGFYEFLYDRNFHQPFSEYKQFLLPEVNAETIQLAGTDVGRMGGVFPKECLEAFFHILL